MYSVNKCIKYIENELRLTVDNGVVKNSINEDVGLCVKGFIDILNEHIYPYEEFKYYNEKLYFLIELLFNNRNKFKTKYKYSLEKCEQFLESLGFEINEDNDMEYGMYKGSFCKGNIDLEHIITFLNDQKDRGGRLEFNDDNLLADLLVRNKDRCIEEAE